MGRSTEILGTLEEILGSSARFDKFEETVGALPVLGPRQYAVPGGAQLLSRQPTKTRQQTLPLSSAGTIAAAAQQTVSNQPQVVFRPERLIISDVNAAFTVQDLKVGKDSQFIASGTMPSAVFGPGAFGVRLKMDTCQVSMFVSVTVTNVSGGAVQFLAAVVGPTVM
jgi:hypothetical protein